MRYLVERGDGSLEHVEAASVGLGGTTLFFYNGEVIVKTFNNHDGWLSFWEVGE